MKILHVINSLNTGGAEKLIVDSIPHYEQLGFAVDVLSLSNHESFFKESIRKNTRAQIFGLTKGSIYNPFLIFRIIPFLQRYDLVHVHLFPSLYFVVFAKILSLANCKLIYTEHNTTNKRRHYRILFLLESFVYSYLDFIGCISKATEENLRKYLPDSGDAIATIFNGINLNSFSITHHDLGYNFFEPNSFVLMMVGSFRDTQKDQPTLIRALLLLPPCVKLLLVGDGMMKQSNEQLVNELQLNERVVFMGNRNDIPSLLHHADVCVLSSNFEGFGLSAVEGMAAGKPVIASDVEGIREIVDGFGLLFEKNNSKELAAHVEDLMLKPEYYQVVSARCYQRSKDFDIKTMAGKYAYYYRMIVNAN